MKTKVIPVGKRVLVKKKDADAYFQGTSILIPENQRKDEYQKKLADLEKGPGEWEALSRRQQVAWEKLKAQLIYSQIDSNDLSNDFSDFDVIIAQVEQPVNIFT